MSFQASPQQGVVWTTSPQPQFSQCECEERLGKNTPERPHRLKDTWEQRGRLRLCFTASEWPRKTEEEYASTAWLKRMKPYQWARCTKRSCKSGCTKCDEKRLCITNGGEGWRTIYQESPRWRAQPYMHWQNILHLLTRLTTRCKAGRAQQCCQTEVSRRCDWPVELSYQTASTVFWNPEVFPSEGVATAQSEISKLMWASDVAYSPI